jgi:hypothetical protein
MARAPVSGLALPRPSSDTVSAGSFTAAMQKLEQADRRNAKLNSTPNFPAVILLAEDGSSWRVTVGTDGVLRTTAVPHT